MPPILATLIRPIYLPKSRVALICSFGSLNLMVFLKMKTLPLSKALPLASAQQSESVATIDTWANEGGAVGVETP